MLKSIWLQHKNANQQNAKTKSQNAKTKSLRDIGLLRYCDIVLLRYCDIAYTQISKTKNQIAKRKNQIAKRKNQVSDIVRALRAHLAAQRWPPSAARNSPNIRDIGLLRYCDVVLLRYCDIVLLVIAILHFLCRNNMDAKFYTKNYC